MKKTKSLTKWKKLYTEFFYRLIRKAGKSRVIKLYHPIVIGRENLPAGEGANLFVGNHRNRKDPVITMAFLENPTHFVALKRLFEYGDNLFGPVGRNPGTLATTFFVKITGALPVAHPTDKDYGFTNLQTFKYVKEYLDGKSSVAIYPEGTLNRDPEKCGNILPLKSNYAFKVAEKGKAVVRPVAIVWLPDEINIEHKVIIAFLKPIHTERLKASEIAAIWDKSMNEAINSINRMVNEIYKIENIEEYEEI